MTIAMSFLPLTASGITIPKRDKAVEPVKSNTAQYVKEPKGQGGEAQKSPKENKSGIFTADKTNVYIKNCHDIQKDIR